MGIEDILLDRLAFSNLRELTVLINGVYYVHSSKLVYVTVQETEDGHPGLSFYTKAGNRVTGGYDRVVVPDALSDINARMLSTELYGVAVPGSANIKSCSVEICENMRLLILESHLYNAVRRVIESENPNSSFIFGNQPVQRELMGRLRGAFIRNSYSTFGDLVYSNTSGRFVNKLMKQNKFYAVQRSFIPVFVDYRKVFNPVRMKDNIIKQTVLYQEAVKKNRFVEVDNLSCYFLTHLEICRALNMTEFMRFTPAFLYRLFIGLLFPDYGEFPGKSVGNGNNEVLLHPGSADVVHLRQPILTLQEAANIVQKNQKVLESGTASELEKSSARDILNELQQYRKINTLYAACIMSYRKLVNIGASVLDDRALSTVDRIYSYVGKASASFIGGVDGA